jgi:hypothetical protein
MAEDIGGAVLSDCAGESVGKGGVEPGQHGFEEFVNENRLAAFFAMRNDRKRCDFRGGGGGGGHGGDGQGSAQLERALFAGHEGPDVGFALMDEGGDGLGRVQHRAAAQGQNEIGAGLFGFGGGPIDGGGFGVGFDTAEVGELQAMALQSSGQRLQEAESLHGAAAQDDKGVAAQLGGFFGEGLELVFPKEDTGRGVDTERVHGVAGFLRLDFYTFWYTMGSSRSQGVLF